MPLRITQKECFNHPRENGDRRHDCETWLKVEGSLYQEDAELLERICRDIGEQTGAALTLDLADLCFLDSDSASVLCRLKREQNVNLEGLHLFIQKVIEITEAEAKQDLESAVSGAPKARPEGSQGQARSAQPLDR